MKKHKKRAMPSKVASKKKKDGHERERRFAKLIGGQVNKGDQQDKKDVRDQRDNFHSVKGGTWW